MSSRSRSSAGRGGSAGPRRWRAALLTLACFLGLATAAHAQLEDLPAVPGGEGLGSGGELLQDPLLQDPLGEPPFPPDGFWEQIAGAEFGSDGVMRSSTTPFDVDFYDVSFHDPTHGLAAGSQCREAQPVRAPGESLESYRAAIRNCDRVPVIYRLVDDQFRGLFWEEAYRGPSETDPGGFVGQVTWLGPDRALAVGGTGIYPRREPGFDSDDPDATERDPAGMGRAWLYENGSWRELERRPDGDAGDEIPDQMRGMVALDASPRPADCGLDAHSDCAVAGALGQLWRFVDGRFEQTPTTSARTKEGNEVPIGLRIREIRFVPGTVASSAGSVVAMTSGCCLDPLDNAPHRLLANPAMLFFDDGEWHILRRGDQPIRTQPHREEFPTTFIEGDLSSLQTAAPDSAGVNSDSYLSFVIGGNVDGSYVPVRALVSPGGPERLREPASTITAAGRLPGGGFPGRPPAAGNPVCRVVVPREAQDAAEVDPSIGQSLPSTPNSLADTSMSCGARLVSADGDVAGKLVTFPDGSKVAKPDELPDWAVGALRSSDRGLAYTTLRLFHPCEDDPQETCESTGLFSLSSYGLNSFELVDDIGRGWAVGDNGAILRLGGGEAFGVEQELPAKIGKAKPGRLAGASAYDAFRPPSTGEPGIVPALAGRPTERLSEPRFVNAGTPDGSLGGGGANPVNSVVMSRDGSEVLSATPFEHAGSAQRHRS